MQIKLSTDFLDGLPEDDPILQRYELIEHSFGSIDRMMIAVRTTTEDDGSVSPAARQRLRQAVDHLGDQVVSWRLPDGESYIRRLDGRNEEERLAAERDLIGMASVFLLDDEEFAQWQHRLNPRRLAARIQRPEAGLPPELQARDPLGLWMDFYIPAWKSLDQGGVSEQADNTIGYQNGYLITRDNDWAVLLLDTTHPAHDSVFAAALSEQLYEMVATFRADPAWAGMRVEIAGAHLLTNRDYQTAISSAIMTAIMSLTGVLALFAIAYRNMRLPVLIFVVLAPAILATAGLAGFFAPDGISIVATSFAAILIGLGVDFLIHIYNAYLWAVSEHHEELAGKELRARCAADALDRVIGAVLIGGCTSAGAFATLLLSNFGHLKEMGLLGCIGIMLTMIMMVVATPAFLTLFGSQKPTPPRRLEHWVHLILDFPRASSGVLVALLIGAAAWFALAPEPMAFDRNPRNLRPANDAEFRRQIDLARELGIFTSGHQVLATGPSEEALLDTTLVWAGRLRPLAFTVSEDTPPGQPIHIPGNIEPADLTGRIHGTLQTTDGTRREIDFQIDGGYIHLEEAQAVAAGSTLQLAPYARMPHSPLLNLPTPSEQRRALARMLEAPIDWDGLLAIEETLSPELRDKHQEFFADLRAIRERLTSQEPMLLSDLSQGPLELAIANFYHHIDDKHFLRIPLDLIEIQGKAFYQLPVSPLGLPDQGRDGPSWTASNDVTIAAAGLPTVFQHLTEKILNDFRLLSLSAAAVVGLILFFAFGRIEQVVLAMGCLGLGVLIMLAALGVIGQSWNLANIAVVPLIAGIGIDNGIHLIHALGRHDRSQQGITLAVRETGFPLLMTTLTSLIGFLSLTTNAYQGVQSIGITAAVGLSACLLATIVTIPLLAQWRANRQAKS
jgi:predicted RND superfamily exporter protein